MKTNRYDIAIAYLCLISGLIISSVAVWYSVAGLVSIFAAAAIPIIIMGVALEGSKLVATVWLKLNWHRAPLSIKAYLSIAIAILMLITSMGIFGYLSKAHLDQNIVSGDVQAKIAIYDEKIATAKGNIDANRRALKQMDEAVDQVMGRSQDEKGADKAVALRRGQAKERTRLLSEIAAEQKTIAQLSEERAPIAAEVRKVEAEVGPIKYIAKLIYGDDPNANVLEKAVTWVIIIIVLVFDPLAVVLLLASQYSFQWLREQKQEESESKEILETDIDLDDSPDPWMEDLVVQKEESKKPFYSQASAFWPFPAKQKDDDFKFLADEKDLYPEEEKKEIIEEIAEPVDEELEEIEIDTELFAEQLLRFPCFQSAPRDKAPDELFDTVFSAYQDENLTEEQDHVVELLLHLQEEESPFNLSRAMEVWGRDDRQVFITLLKELDEILEQDIDEDDQD